MFPFFSFRASLLLLLFSGELPQVGRLFLSRQKVMQRGMVCCTRNLLYFPGVFLLCVVCAFLIFYFIFLSVGRYFSCPIVLLFYFFRSCFSVIKLELIGFVANMIHLKSRSGGKKKTSTTT